jgi:hypothetical protein
MAKARTLRPPADVGSWPVYAFPRQLDAYALDRLPALPLEGPLVLDLGRTVFIKPLGMAALYWIVRESRAAGRLVHVMIGSESVATYLCRMNFHTSFGSDPGVTFAPDLRTKKLRRAKLPTQLMEFTLVHVDNDDAVEQASLQVMGIVQSKAQGFDAIRDELFTAIAELLSNVERHSGVHEACVVAQTHKHTVRIAVGDNGCGIRATLARTRAAAIQAMSDGEVNRFATEAGVTGAHAGGGYGLWTIASAVRKRGEAFHILSGSGRCSIWRWRDTVRQLGQPVRGTLVEVALARV